MIELIQESLKIITDVHQSSELGCSWLNAMDNLSDCVDTIRLWVPGFEGITTVQLSILAHIRPARSKTVSISHKTRELTFPSSLAPTLESHPCKVS